ncbi:MAG: retroviral-like aspartic protease family protein [Bacteroidetes bacterium]|nr:retroviral-like aspartic protease family protein [Bacteroidota bacterium]MCY4204488.1 retroviral-like aspartic protease family protein [Bacteroidota bacterium]
MPPFLAEIENNQAIIKAAVGRPGSLNNMQGYDALLDTGAQSTLVSQKVVDELGFIPIGSDSIRTVEGNIVTTKKYHINVGILVQFGSNDIVGTGFTINVASLPFQPANFDVLLGMDLISRFHMTFWGNRIIISN